MTVFNRVLMFIPVRGYETNYYTFLHLILHMYALFKLGLSNTTVCVSVKPQPGANYTQQSQVETLTGR